MNAIVRAAVIHRANGLCEACRLPLNGRGEVDHFWGRARSETVATCWLLHPECHRAKTASSPDRVTWLERFFEFTELNGYDTTRAVVELAWAKAKAALPFGLRRKERAA